MGRKDLANTGWRLSAVVLSSLAVAFGGGAATPVPAAASVPGRAFAPYFETWLSDTIPSVAQASGSKYFTLAFVLGGGTGCQAMWNGVIPVSPANRGAEISALRSMGGDVIVSFGGASGPYLEQFCTDPASLEKQYQVVVDTYGITSVDFDVEAMWDQATLDRRNQALAMLQHAKGTTVSYTLPVDQGGLTALDIQVLQSAIHNGVNVSVVNGMTMDYGGAVGDMGAAAIQAANSMFTQLQQLYPGRSAAQIWAMEGNTPMIGQNDSGGEVFSTGNASTLLSFARSKGIGRLAFWAAQRDNPCPGGGAVDHCSGTGTGAWAYSHIFDGYNGGGPGAPPPTARPTPTSTPVPPPGAPGAPTGVSAFSLGGGRASVSWSAPGSNGGSAVTYYDVYTYPQPAGNPNQVVAGTSAVVSGLQAGRYYTFVVVAWNGSRWGSWSGWATWMLAT